MTGSSGPKISSRVTAIASVTSAMAVGAILRTCGEPMRAGQLARRIDRLDAGALGSGILDQALEPFVVAAVDDRGVVGIVEDARIEAGGRLPEQAQELLDPAARHEGVVGRDAGLSGVEQLAAHDALDGARQIAVGMHDRRRFAAELQRDRHQVLRRGRHHLLADRGRAGEQDVVEGQPAQALGHLGSAERNRHPVGAEPSSSRRLSRADVAGVSSDGLMMTRLPAASAAASGPTVSCRG